MMVSNKTDLGERMRTASAGQRVTWSMLSGAVAGAVVSLFTVPSAAILVGWDVAVVIYVAWVWIAVWRLDPVTTGRLAKREDPRGAGLAGSAPPGRGRLHGEQLIGRRRLDLGELLGGERLDVPVLVRLIFGVALVLLAEPVQRCRALGGGHRVAVQPGEVVVWPGVREGRRRGHRPTSRTGEKGDCFTKHSNGFCL